MSWVKISNFNYSINEVGQVRNDSTGKMKAPFLNKKTGYLCVDLYRDNVSYKRTLHRLLAEAFIPNPDNKPTVDHKNGIRTDNSLSNLRWATYSEQNSRFSTLGVRSEKIVATHESGSRIEFCRISDAADYFGCGISNISQMLKKGTYGKRGRTRYYKFEYVTKKF